MLRSGLRWVRNSATRLGYLDEMTDNHLQQQIRAELEVVQDFDAAREAERRIRFLADYLMRTGLRGLVLGISGGVDSSVGGRLCQLACERVRTEGHDAVFVAMRLPYGVQADESEAQRALEFIGPDEVYSVNIKPAVDAMWEQCTAAGLAVDDTLGDFVIDDYLQGRDIAPEDEAIIRRWYNSTAHKRAQPVTPAGWEVSQAGSR